MTDKFGLGSSHESRQTMNGDIDDGPAPLFISTEEESSVVERKKTVHNSTEKKRKEQIRFWIQQIGEQLPPLVTTKSEKERHGRSTLEIVEKACNYIKELKGRTEHDEELEKVRIELENMRAERDRLQEILKMAGYAATQEVPPQGTPVPEAPVEQEKKKTKKRNTINLQLELKKQQAAAAQQQENQQQQQNAALATGAAGMQDMLAQGIVGNPMTNFPNMMIGGAGQQLINQQMFMNSMMFGVPPAGGSQMPMGGNPCMQAQTQLTQGVPGQTVTVQQSDKNAAEAGAGLLQLAMQDAGITPSSNSNPTQTEDSLSTTAPLPRSNATDQNTVSSALHTLASVASNTQNVTNVSQIPASQMQSNASMIQTGATTTTTQSVNSMAPIMATGQQNLNGSNGVMNVPFVNGQQQMAANVMPGNQIVNPGTSNAMQQIMFINEQGVPCIANIPVGIDPSSLGLPNGGKQIVGMDKSGNLLIQNMSGQKDDQQAILANTLAQQQMNLALQGIQQPFQQGQTNVTMGTNNMVQQPVNNQLALNQHIMQPMQGSIQGMNNSQNPQGLILPASQTGNLLTVNSVPSFSNPQNQLPQALLLPNGQIIPVVSNPNLFAPGQAPANQLITPGGQPNAIQQGAGIPPRVPVPQNIVSSDGSQMMVTSTGQLQVAQQNIQGQGTVQQGLLMTTNSILPQVSPSNSSTASGTTSLVTTSVITSTVTSTSGVSSHRKPKTSLNVTTATEDVLLSQAQGSLVQTGMDSSTAVTSQVMTSDPNSASMKILNPQLQSVLHGQLGGSTAPILLTMNCNGQPTSILVDPTTMQVLGTVQTQQPPQQPNINPATSVSNSTPSKKNKKNAQRAICPKPQMANSSSAITTVTSVINPIVGPNVTLPTQANPAVGTGVWNSDKESMEVLPPPSAPAAKKSSKSKSKSKANKANSENQLEAPGKTDSGEMGEQDILAKAAESIFSEISPVNFYNPANEDNPLQIDTSVCEGDDEGKESESPKKDVNKVKVSDTGATDNSPVLDSEMTESNAETVRTRNKKDFTDSLKEQSSDENDILTNILKAAESNEQEKSTETGNNSNDQVGESLFDIMSSTSVERAKKSKKSKKSKTANNTAELSDVGLKDATAVINIEEKSSAQSSKKSGKKSKKTEQENSLKESVVEQESLMSMPEEITFCENDIEDVLNQVEKMGNSFESSTSSISKKSSKSKKDRNENADSEPAIKRRKRNLSKEKSKEAAEPSPQAVSGAKPSLSVYDFDDTDFSTPLFPLHSTRNISGGCNTKNQTASSSSDKTPTSSSSPLFSMPVITTESSSTTPLFDDFPLTPKKRGKHKKNKKVEDKTCEVSGSKKSDNDLLNSNSVDRLSSETRTESDKNSSSDVTKKNSDSSLEKMDIDYSSKDNGFLSKSDSRQQQSLSFTSEQTNKNSTPVSFESHGNKEQQMSVTTQSMDTNKQDRADGHLNASRRSVASRSNVEQMSVDTNPLTVDTNDIESTVNNLLGLSPHMLSPGNQSSLKQKQVQQSPQLQTPKSASPASMKSPMTSPAVTYQQQMHMSNEHIMSRTSASSSISVNPNLTYSAESLFNSPPKHLDSSRGIDTSTNSSQLPQNSRMPDTSDSMMKSSEENSSAVRPKSIYSADNFVQSAKSNKSSKPAPNVLSPSLSSNMSRGQNENSSDGFNFSNIGLNLSTPTTSTNSFMDSLTMSPIISTVANSTTSSTPFTFTLSSVSSTHTTSSASMMQSSASQSQNSSHQGNHNFPFYSPHQSPQRPPSHHQRPPTTSASPQHTNSAPNNISSNQSQRPPVNNLSNFDLNLPPSNTQMPSSQPSQRRASREHDARMSQHIPTMPESQYSYGMARNCSVQDQRPREQTMPREEPPSFPNITVTTHEGPLNMGMSKSNPHKRMNDIGQGSMSSKSTSDSRSDRSVGYGMNSSGMQPFFPPPNFSNSTSNPLETPLHHPSMLGTDNRSSMSVRGFDPVFSPSQSYNPVQQNFGGNRYESNNVPPFSQRDSSGTQPLSHTPPNQAMDGRKSANTPSSQTAKANKQPSQPMQGNQANRTMNGPPSHRSGPTPPHVQPQGSHRPTPQQQLSQQPSQQSRSKSSSSSSRSSSSKQSQKKKQTYVEMESGIPPHPAMFEANRMTPLFPLPPQARSPTFPASLFGSGPHQGASMSKNTELSSPFNQLFPPARPQNGLGFQFNNFGMNSVHSAMSNSPQITPHSGSVTVTPHMSNFTFTNIFSDVNNSSQNDALNISPIKFPHPNPMLPPQGMDPNTLHHPHQQGSSIYHHHHNRAHPSSVIHNAMNINSILGHNHHSFDSRGMSQGMNTSVAPPFPGHGHPAGFGMPPLNFSMHDT